MKLSSILLVVAPIMQVHAQAQVLVDLSTMESLALQIADTINASLNGSLQLNTSALVSSIVPSIQQSNDHINSANASYSSNGTSIDPAYLSYLGGISSLAEAALRRGRIFHSEMNLPVYQALKGLATVVQSYGVTLASHNMTDDTSRIQTFQTGSTIVNAEGAWANNVNYPGRKREERDDLS